MDATSYDALPYEDYVHPDAHPEHLAAVARLVGHAAPDPARARVLELGCARGGHLVPVAEALPGSECVGVDLSARQVDEGNAAIARVGLGNVRLHACSLVDVGERFGRFDYVLCHGVYSWVPLVVRAEVLALCARVLTPTGVALVSYNTLPGWTAGRTLRDFLRLHARPAHGPAAQVAAARDAMKLLAEGLGSDAGPYASAMRAEVARARGADESYFFHEYLEAVNDPVYLADFVADARARGLDHLVDADLASVVPDALAKPDPVPLEQSVDFLRNRRFRASLLVRAEGLRRRRPTPEALAGLHWSTRAELAEDGTEAGLKADAPLAFSLDERRFTLRSPLAKCALLALVEAERRPVAWGEVCARVAARLGQPGLRAKTAWLATSVDLAGMLFAGRVRPHIGPARYAAEAGLRPRATALARDQAARGRVVTTGRHTQVELPPAERAVLCALDGTRDRSALAERLRATEGDVPGLAGRVEEALDWLACNALLVG